MGINLYIFKIFSDFSLDSPEPNQLGLQDSGCLYSENLIFFHDNIMVFIMLVLSLIGWLLLSSIGNHYYNSYLMENNFMEMVWTLTPAMVLIMMALPSLHLLYLLDENMDPSLTIKVIGHQWYWSYEYSNFFPVIDFDSYMTPTSDLEIGDLSLLEVDNSLFMPMNTEVKMIITSSDVIHSWTVPSLGCKVDAIPGSLNQICLNINSPGKFYGQCSELCGSNHSFMPMNMSSVSKDKFLSWCSSF